MNEKAGDAIKHMAKAKRRGVTGRTAIPARPVEDSAGRIVPGTG